MEDFFVLAYQGIFFAILTNNFINDPFYTENTLKDYLYYTLIPF